MAASPNATRMDQVIREYIQACNDGDAEKIAAYLHADAIHYYPNHPKFVGASTIAAHFVKRVWETGVCWTVDQIAVDPDCCIAVLESLSGHIPRSSLRGFLFYTIRGERPDPSWIRIILVRAEHAANFGGSSIHSGSNRFRVASSGTTGFRLRRSRLSDNSTVSGLHLCLSKTTVN